jgi:hypothetical protein
MMGREGAQNMWSIITEKIWIITASGRLFKKKFVTMHGNMNVNAPIHFIIPYCSISFEQFVLNVLIVVD